MEMIYEVDSEKPSPISSSLKLASPQQKKKEFRFEWIIENVSMSIQEKWQTIESPRFRVEDNVETGWFLKLYPKGTIDEKFMACYLQREIACQQRYDLTNFTLSYLNDDGALEEVEKFHDADFSDFGSNQIGTDRFKSIGVVCNKLLDRKKDILIIYCDMWWYQNTKSPLVYCSARTHLKIERCCFAWDLWGVRKSSTRRIPPVMESKIKVPMISTHLASCFELELQFEYDVSKYGRYEWAGCIYLLVTGMKETPIYTKLKITTKQNAISEFSICESGNHIFQPSTSLQKWFFSNVPGKNEINRGWFLVDYKLNLICELIISTGEEFKQIEEIKCGLPIEEINDKKKRQFKTNIQNFPRYEYLHTSNIIDKNVYVEAPIKPGGSRPETISPHSYLKSTLNQSKMTDGFASITSISSLQKDFLSEIPTQNDLKSIVNQSTMTEGMASITNKSYLQEKLFGTSTPNYLKSTVSQSTMTDGTASITNKSSLQEDLLFDISIHNYLKSTVNQSTMTDGMASITNKGSLQEGLLKSTVNQSTMTDGMISVTDKSSLQEDLFLFYSNKTLCDSYLLANDAKIYVHRVILAARSPVLFNIIKQNENDSIIEDISNSNSATLLNFIKYLYTDHVEDLRIGSVLQMYFCAKKYEVRDLQAKCFQVLKTISSLVGICDIFSVDGRQDENIKHLALEFFAINAKEIFNSEEWEEAVKEKSQIAVKLMTRVCMNLSQKLP